MAEMVDWKTVAESMRQKANTAGILEPSKPGLVKLALQPEPIFDREQRRPRIKRRADIVHPVIQEAFHRVCSGLVAWPLLLVGQAGVGKTCAGLSLLDHAGGQYWTAAELSQSCIDLLRGQLTWQHEGRSGTYSVSQFWREQGRQPLIVLDELACRDRVSDHHYECVQRMLDERNGAPLLAISNHGLERIAKIYDDRIASRLAAGTVVEVQGDDRRMN